MLIQKKWETEINFDFMDTELYFKIKDQNGTNTMKIPYVEIDIQNIDQYIEQNEWLKNVWILWVCIWIGLQFLAQQHNSWMIIWLVCLIIFHFRKIKYSILNTDRWRIFIMLDENHDKILDQIRKHKRDLLRQKFYFYDKENSPENELNKYEFLKNEGAITDEEYKKLCEELFAKK